jgi:hypothetical protein
MYVASTDDVVARTLHGGQSGPTTRLASTTMETWRLHKTLHMLHIV